MFVREFEEKKLPKLAWKSVSFLEKTKPLVTVEWPLVTTCVGPKERAFSSSGEKCRKLVWLVELAKVGTHTHTTRSSFFSCSSLLASSTSCLTQKGVTISTRFLVCAKKRNRDAIWKETQFLLIDICFFFFRPDVMCNFLKKCVRRGFSPIILSGCFSRFLTLAADSCPTFFGSATIVFSCLFFFYHKFSFYFLLFGKKCICSFVHNLAVLSSWSVSFVSSAFRVDKKK